jgi:hypothetical protein
MPDEVRYFLPPADHDRVSPLLFSSTPSHISPLIITCAPHPIPPRAVLSSPGPQVHELFNYGMIERFKLQFLEVNTSRSGRITDQEFNLFLQTLQIDVSPSPPLLPSLLSTLSC